MTTCKSTMSLRRDKDTAWSTSSCDQRVDELGVKPYLQSPARSLRHALRNSRELSFEAAGAFARWVVGDARPCPLDPFPPTAATR